MAHADTRPTSKTAFYGQLRRDANFVYERGRAKNDGDGVREQSGRESLRFGLLSLSAKWRFSSTRKSSECANSPPRKNSRRRICSQECAGTFNIKVFSEDIPAMHGRPAGALIIFQDITELKNTEVELRRAQADLRESVDIANVGFWSVDAESQNITVSLVLMRQFGIDLKNFAGTLTEAIDVIHEADRARAPFDRRKQDKRYSVPHRIPSGAHGAQNRTANSIISINVGLTTAVPTSRRMSAMAGRNLFIATIFQRRSNAGANHSPQAPTTKMNFVCAITSEIFAGTLAGRIPFSMNSAKLRSGTDPTQTSTIKNYLLNS